MPPSILAAYKAIERYNNDNARHFGAPAIMQPSWHDNFNKESVEGNIKEGYRATKGEGSKTWLGNF